MFDTDNLRDTKLALGNNGSSEIPGARFLER